MKATDYIVQFLIAQKIDSVFGYPGGMVTYLMDSLAFYKDYISSNLCYHEQAAAFAACGYAQSSNKVGVAFATSGPGATNLITGICHAYFDSVPTIFITGQVNTFESKKSLPIRQNGFQETDIVSMVQGVTKYAKYVSSVSGLPKALTDAYIAAISERPGPVLLDIPMDVQKSEIDAVPSCIRIERIINLNQTYCDTVYSLLLQAKRPCILAGGGIKTSKTVCEFRRLVSKWNIPVLYSMVAVDVGIGSDVDNYGFIGAYGSRSANIILEKSDLIICFGSRLDIRQIGAKKEYFAPNAKLIRFDIDENEFSRIVKSDEIQIKCDLRDVIPMLYDDHRFEKLSYPEWIAICKQICKLTCNLDNSMPNLFISELSKQLLSFSAITIDVGQNQIWTAQSFNNHPSQKLLFSAGHGSMGYALPAAIGSYYALRKPVACIVGDGGFQMNIQELEFIKRENLPILVVVINNHALGMIRHFQEMYFHSRFTQTIETKGYSVPDFSRVSSAYQIHYNKISSIRGLSELILDNNLPQILEIELLAPTYVAPKLEYGRPNCDQTPLMDRALFSYLKEL